MRDKLKSVFGMVIAAAITVGACGAAVAATVGVAGVSGTWTTLMPPNGPTNVKGLDTSAVSWGTPYGNSKKQSGYSFVGAAAGEIETDKDFDLGTFTHNNFVINAGTSITGANLGIIIDLVIGDVTRVVNAAFSFDHWETKNNGESNGRCADGGKRGAGVNAAGCADRVTINDNTSSSESFEIDGFMYILEITGFTVAGQFFSQFWTSENAENSAILKARFTLVGPATGGGGGEPIEQPSPVPLPAAGWMILSALGALAAMRATRKV